MIGGRWPDRRALINSIPLLQRLAIRTRPEPTDAASDACWNAYLRNTGQPIPPPPAPPDFSCSRRRGFWIAMAVVVVMFAGSALDSHLTLDRQAAERQKVAGQEQSAALRTHLEDLVASHQVAVGMTAEQVRRSWGEPRQRTHATTPIARIERWVYPHGDVYLDDDHVTQTDLW